MNCTEARSLLLDLQRDRLDPVSRGEIESHLTACADCSHEREAEAMLTKAIAGLPRHDAPRPLIRDLRARYAPSSAPATPPAFTPTAAVAEAAPARKPMRAWQRVAFVTAAAVAIAASVWVFRKPASDPLVVEAVNDHLRVVYSEHPIEIASGGIHQVKPWFTGRLDFAPAMPFAGDEDFPLEGGSIAYFVDRKAAAYVFKKRLHTISVFVFPAEGLPWGTPTKMFGNARGVQTTSRGFNVFVWRSGDLGYAAVSDLNPKDLETLVTRIAK